MLHTYSSGIRLYNLFLASELLVDIYIEKINLNQFNPLLGYPYNWKYYSHKYIFIYIKDKLSPVDRFEISAAYQCPIYSHVLVFFYCT